MTLDRWIAFVVLCVALVYGYTAFFTMDQLLPPFMQRNPVWPSTFPKILAVLALVTSLVILLGLEKPSEANADKQPDIDYRRLMDYNLGQAVLLLMLMVAYALLLRPIGFLLATAGFLTLGAAVLGERKFYILIPVAAFATGVVWYLVQVVLGIFLRPLPWFM